MRRLWMVVLGCWMVGLPMWAQAPAARFEVISIRLHSAASGPPQFGPTANGFHAIGMPLFAIFQMAYAPADQGGVLRGDRIVGAPAWLTSLSDRYDIVAKVGERDLADWHDPAKETEMRRAMLRALLAERFQAVVHHESREMPTYELVVSKGGPKFKEAETVDAAELKAKHPGGGMPQGGGLAVPGPEGIHLYAVSMTMLADEFLSSRAGRPVVDRTGLTGRYDLLMPASALGPPPPPPGAPPAMSSPPAGSDHSESIFTALPEELGLKLQPAKGQVEMLVIDHVERPTEN